MTVKTKENYSKFIKVQIEVPRKEIYLKLEETYLNSTDSIVSSYCEEEFNIDKGLIIINKYPASDIIQLPFTPIDKVEYFVKIFNDTLFKAREELKLDKEQYDKLVERLAKFLQSEGIESNG